MSIAERTKKGQAQHPLSGLPVGSSVIVTLDGGQKWVTVTRSEPWQLGSGQWVVSLVGKSGGYSLDRVEVAK